MIMKLFLGVAQVVARYLGVVEAVGSSPATQTNLERPPAFVGGLLLYLQSCNHAGLQMDKEYSFRGGCFYAKNENA